MSGVGWSPRQHAPVLGAPQRALDRNLWRAIERKGPCLYVSTDGSRRACGVGACPRLLPTKSDPRETSGPQIDRIPSTRPSWWDRQYRELKKLFFSPPSKCPIDLFGPVANRAILKQLHVTSRSSSRNPRRRSATPRLESKNLLVPSLQSPISPDQSPISNQPSAGTPNLQCPMPVLGYKPVFPDGMDWDLQELLTQAPLRLSTGYCHTRGP